MPPWYPPPIAPRPPARPTTLTVLFSSCYLQEGTTRCPPQQYAAEARLHLDGNKGVRGGQGYEGVRHPAETGFSCNFSIPCCIWNSAPVRFAPNLFIQTMFTDSEQKPLIQTVN